MRFSSRDVSPLRVLAFRALVAYPLLRVLLTVVGAMLAAFAGRAAAAELESPLGVVLLAAALGALDIRRRGESVLWANLGYPAVTTPALFGLVALAGELTLIWVRS